MLALIRDLLKELSISNAVDADKLAKDKILDLINENGRISAAIMAERLGLSQRQIQRLYLFSSVSNSV